ncbi:MAG: phosphoribosyltransferase family protein [Thermoleophilia bacterium]
MGESEREILTWERFGRMSEELATRIAADGFKPDAILGIARGGLLLAGALAYGLGVKPVFLINVEFYTGVEEHRSDPVILPPQLQVGDIADKRLLIVDDVADTGATLETVQKICQEAVREVRTAVLYEKPISTVRCEYVGARTDRWIEFPWTGD